MEIPILIAVAGALLVAAVGLGAFAARERGRARALEERLAAAQERAGRIGTSSPETAASDRAELPNDADDAVIAELIHLVDLASGSALAAQAGRALAAAGVEESSPRPGEPFDPELHAVVSTEPSEEYEWGTILRIERPGWKRRGTLIRTADVTVAARPEAEGV